MGEQPDGVGTAPDVRLQLTHGPDGPGVLADGRALPVPPHTSPTEVGLAAARRHAARSGRELRVEVVDGATVTLVAVSPHGTVTLLEAPPTERLPRVVVPDEPVTAIDRTTVQAVPPRVRGTPGSAWVSPPPTRPRRPVSSLVIAGLAAVAVLVGAVGTGVATLSSSASLPDSCRPVTIYAVGGQGGSSDVLKGVTDPLAKQFGEKVSVVTVPAPPTGGSFASAESDAVSSLAKNVGDHVDGCPTGSLMLFGYSQGAQVAGDLASRVGTGLEPRIPARLVQAVGLFGDPARSPRTRAVPDGTAGQGALPPRAVGFGALDARTIEICAPGDPVCGSPANAASPPLEQAVDAPVHGSYPQLPVAAGTTAPQWAAASLGKVVAAIPTTAGPAPTSTGTAPQSGPATTTPGAYPSSSDGSAGSGTGSTDAAPPSTGAGSTGSGAPTTTSAPPGAGDGSGTSGDGGSYEAGGAGGGGSAATTPPARPGSSATGGTGGSGTGAGADVSTRRSGSAVSTTTAEDGTTSDSTGTGTRSSGARTGSSGSGSTGTGSGSSGTVSSGQGSPGASDTSVNGNGSGSASSGGHGNADGTGATGTGTGSSAPASTRAPSGRPPSGSASSDSTPEQATTTTAAGGRGADDTKTQDKKGKKTDETHGSTGTTTSRPSSGGRGSTGTKTDAGWSLVKGLTGFKSTPWNNQNATDPTSAPSPNVPGRQAVEFEMPGGGKRTEAEPDVPEFREGQKAFVGYSGFFDRGFPTTTGTWQVIMQFKQPGTGSPPLAVEVGKGQLRLANNGRNQEDFCPVTDGQAFSFRLGITFGGAIDAWCNGQQTLSGYRTPESNVQGSAYLKTGIYRDESIRQDSKLFVNDLKVGLTLESVSGLAGADATGTPPPAQTDTGAVSDRAAADTATTTSAPSGSAVGTGPTAQPASAATGTGTTRGTAATRRSPSAGST